MTNSARYHSRYHGNEAGEPVKIRTKNGKLLCGFGHCGKPAIAVVSRLELVDGEYVKRKVPHCGFC